MFLFVVKIIRNKQTPLVQQQPYLHRNPHIRNQQEPNIRNQQQPNIRNQQEPNIRNKQEPNIRDQRNPFTYDHRSPFTYTVEVNRQSPYNANAQTTVPYIHTIQVTYNHRSPFTYQVSYQNRRPITDVAKVKGVFLKQTQGVTKVDKVFVKKDSSTVEKIHQSVPTAQFSK